MGPRVVDWHKGESFDDRKQYSVGILQSHFGFAEGYGLELRHAIGWGG